MFFKIREASFSVPNEISLGVDIEQNKEKQNEILELLGLNQFSDRHPASLSGGQKQRVLLALSILCNRNILVFDEPTSGLDGRNMKITANLLKELAGKGKVVLLITHDTELIDLAADCLLHLDSNNITESAKT